MAAASCVLVGLPACTSEPPTSPAPPSAVVVAVPVGPQHLDPDGPLDEFTASVLVNSYEWLVALDTNLNPAPMLAERWTTLDENTWLFELRRGVRFHDGRALDAQLAAQALRRGIASRHPDDHRIEAVEVRGDHQIVVRTAEPRVAVINVADVALALEPRSGLGPLVGTGAYTIVSGRPLGSIKLRAFDGHWSGVPAVRALEFRVIPDEWQRLRALTAGEVDLVVNLSVEGAATVEEMPNARLARQGSLRTLCLGLVLRPGGNVKTTPFGDVRVRRAVAHALDRAGLVRRVLGGQGELIDQIVTPEIFGYVADLEPITYDPESSRRLLREAGYPDGIALTLSFPEARYQSIEAVARAVATDLEAVGIHATLLPEGPGSIAHPAPVAEAFLMGWITSHSALSSYGQLFHTPGGMWGAMNLMRHSDPEVDAALAVAARAPVEEQRLQLLAVGRRLRETLPVVPLYRQVDLYGVAAGLAFAPRPQRQILGRELRWQGRPGPG